MPGRVASGAAAEATIPESPIAVPCRPDTFPGFAAAVRHADAGARDADADAGDVAAGDADGLAEVAAEPVALELAPVEAPAGAWGAALLRCPSAPCCSSPDGAAGPGGRATP